MKIRLQRVIQGVSLALVLALVLFAGNGGGRPSCGPVLEARPLAGVVMHLVCREFLPSLAPALATRPYALLLVPLWEGGLALGIEAFAPFLEAAHATDLFYLQIEQGSFRTAFFVLVFWLVLAVLECVRPRFWCRYLCPAGALLALFARLVPFRIVRERTCTGCGQCALACPAGLEAPGMSGNRAMACECLPAFPVYRPASTGHCGMPRRPGFSKGVQAAPPVLRAGPFACPLLRALALALCRVLISHDLRPFPCAPQVRFRSRTFLRAACVEAFACRPAPAMRCSLPGCRQAWEGSFPLSMTQGVGPVCQSVCAAVLSARHTPYCPCLFPRRDGPGWA